MRCWGINTVIVIIIIIIITIIQPAKVQCNPCLSFWIAFGQKQSSVYLRTQ